MNLNISLIESIVSDIIEATYPENGCPRTASGQLAETISQRINNTNGLPDVQINPDAGLSNVIREFDKGFESKALLITKVTNFIGLTFVESVFA